MTRKILRPVLTAGVDEAGRGPLAGPVFVAAVILNPARPIRGIDDSKQLKPERRRQLDQRIRERAIAFSVIAISAADVDRLNIFQATMYGMACVVAALSPAAEYALIDGPHIPKNLHCGAHGIIDGDALEKAIGAASILAKVARDAHMCELDARYPGYGFAQHKGYSTPEHLAALQRLGPCHEHRTSFAPVRAMMSVDLFAPMECVAMA